MKLTLTHRNTRYRLVPGTVAKARALSKLAGATRYVWNWALAANQEAMQAYKQGEGDKPSVSFFSLGKQFTELRRTTLWLQELPFAPVRYVLKRQADAWKVAFKHGGFPRFKGRWGDDSVTLPDNIRIDNGKLYIPRLGWYRLRRRGGNPYQRAKPVQAVIKQERGRWFVTVCYQIEDKRVDNGCSLGLDMNVRQVTTSDGEIIRLPILTKLEARKRRYQRMMARRKRGSNRRAKARGFKARTERKIANIRSNWQHQVSHDLAEQAGTVVIEDLNTKGMTAKGGNYKRGLNREILNTGWRGLRNKLAYKAARLMTVPAAYTSQTCNVCGHIDPKNRRSQAEFRCTVCSHEANADHNAALNVLASGIGATGRREAFSLETSMNRQKVYESALAGAYAT